MKNSKFWRTTVFLQFACVWALVIALPPYAGAQVRGAASGNLSGASVADSGWESYGHDAGGTRYSPAAQINRDNVGQLKVAWTYRTGALDGIDDDLKRSAAFEATPILVDGRLYLSTPFDHVIALEPETGKKIWEYDPKLNTYGFSETTSRGVSVWKDSEAKAGQPCRLRIFIGTLDARLIAVDGETGKACADFGAGGQIDLTKDVNLRDAGEYQVTSAPAIAGDLVITGSSIGDNRAVELERGIVRAFDVRSGKLRWSWDPIPWASKSSPRTGVETTSGRTPWWRCTRRRANLCGAFRWCTTICGITT